jgi:pyochelin biosynthetic protein PchC
LRDRPVPSGRTVYCVPSAGTGARTFLASFASSPLRENLRVVQLPGREDRIDEPCMDDVMQMAALVAHAVAAEQCENYALFGHSFGALVMLETARSLERMHAPAPAVLAVAACLPPHLPAFDRFDEMTPAQIVEVLQNLGGLDLSGPRGERLRPLILPALIADCRASTRYLDAAGRGTVHSPIVAMGGSRDPAVAVERMAGWREYTDAGFSAQEYPGGHFFPLESELALRTVIDWHPDPAAT